MTTRVVELRSGNRVRAIELSTPLSPAKTRSAKIYESSLVREMLNIKTAALRLEFLLYANFSPDDLFVTLTYDDGHLPPNYEAARKNAPAFFRLLREDRKAAGYDTPYVYVMEGLHGDHRVHHHCVLKRKPGDFDRVRRCWANGSVDIRTIEEFGGIQKLAQYLSKEPRKTGKLRVGQRMWTPSKGLIRPERIDYELDSGEHYSPPTNAVPAAGGRMPERIDNAYGSYVLFDYVLESSNN